ncbi:MAG: Rho termination factor N-terminal domain-containing protein [Clostridia bacterium]|nr:Rho termination factor N-terminal domain-containing protein [Clostridia bacterium]
MYSLVSREGTYTYDELSSYTKAELLEIAEQNGISGLSLNMLKADIINAIIEAV